MGGDGLDLDDLDAALDGLSQAPAQSEATPEVAPAGDGHSSQKAPADSLATVPGGPPGGPPPLSPPPVRRRATSRVTPAGPDGWSGRTAFDDLFVTDTAALPSARGGAEEKVEYFREKLKRSEAMTARFREAWQVREREMDVVESLMDQEKGRTEEQAAKAADLTQKLHALEGFL